MSNENQNMMKYVCPDCGLVEEHYSEALAHPEKGVYDVTTYSCPICSTGTARVFLEATGRADTRQLLQG